MRWACLMWSLYIYNVISYTYTHNYSVDLLCICIYIYLYCIQYVYHQETSKSILHQMSSVCLKRAIFGPSRGNPSNFWPGRAWMWHMSQHSWKNDSPSFQGLLVLRWIKYGYIYNHKHRLYTCLWLSMHIHCMHDVACNLLVVVLYCTYANIGDMYICEYRRY
jgi:hypothetical protein